MPSAKELIDAAMKAKAAADPNNGQKQVTAAVAANAAKLAAEQEKPEPKIDAPAVAEAPAPVEVKPRKVRVELKHLPAREYELKDGEDRLDAIDRYKRDMGVISTEHDFKVESV